MNAYVRLTSSRVFVLVGLRPPRKSDPLPSNTRSDWTFIGSGRHLFRPVDIVGDQDTVLCTRFALEFAAPQSVATADELTASMEGALSLFSREPHPIRAAAATPLESGAVRLDAVLEQAADDYNMDDTEPAYIELLDLDGPPRRHTRWLLAALARSVPERTLSALRAFRHSVEARVDAYGWMDDDDLRHLVLPTVAHDPDRMSTALLQAYRAIEAQLGGGLPARANKARQTLVAHGFDPGVVLPGGERLDAALEHAERVRGVVAHGGNRAEAVAPAELVHVQRLARYLLLVALRSARR